MLKPYLSTYTGAKLHFLDPDPSEITIQDIAHQTAMKVRFGGAVRQFYSVAQHSALGVSLIRGNWATRLAFLLHDANEAYLPDVQRPIKREIAATWEKIELPLEEAIYLTLMGASYYDVDWTEVKRVDNFMLAVEARSLLTDPSFAYEAHWGVPADLTLDDVPGYTGCLSPEKAKTLFLHHWTLLSADPQAPVSFHSHLLNRIKGRESTMAMVQP